MTVQQLITRLERVRARVGGDVPVKLVEGTGEYDFGTFLVRHAGRTAFVSLDCTAGADEGADVPVLDVEG